jgi:methyl-accepting chemotaxis protein
VLGQFEAITESVQTVSAQEDEIRNSMEEQNAGSKQILDAVSQLNSLTQQVKAGSVEMLEGSRQVITESRNLESATLEITNGINDMAAGADHINSAVMEVKDISGKNKTGIETLALEVSKFKV